MGVEGGIMRQMNALRKNLPDAAGADPYADRWRCHIEGALGEMAFAKAGGIYFGYKQGVFHTEADIGKLIEVRTAQMQDRLIVRPKDKTERLFVLLTGWSPCFRVWGWMLGSEAKQDKYWQDPNGRGFAWFVPKSDLHPLNSAEEIRAVLEEHGETYRPDAGSQ